MQRGKALDEESEVGLVEAFIDNFADENLGEDEVHTEGGDEADDVETTAKAEEECKSQVCWCGHLNITFAHNSYSGKEDVRHGIISNAGKRIRDFAGQVRTTPASGSVLLLTTPQNI